MLVPAAAACHKDAFTAEIATCGIIFLRIMGASISSCDMSRRDLPLR